MKKSVCLSMSLFLPVLVSVMLSACASNDKEGLGNA
jgi:predicted small secreted protein